MAHTCVQYEKHRSNLQWEFYIANQIKTRVECSGADLTKECAPIAIFHRLDIFQVSVLFLSLVCLFAVAATLVVRHADLHL